MALTAYRGSIFQAHSQFTLCVSAAQTNAETVGDVMILFSFLQGWLNRRSPLEAEILLSLFDRFFEDLFNFTVHNLNAKMEVLQSMQIMQACNLLEGLIPHNEHKHPVTENFLEKLVVFSVMWSVGECRLLV